MRGSTAGFSDTLRGDSCARTTTLCVLDSLFSALVVAPAVVGYWRSVWELMQVYVFPDDTLTSAVTSTVIGYVGHVLFTLLQHPLTEHVRKEDSRIAFFVVSRVYTVVFAFVCVNGWRGPWVLMDEYTSMATVAATTLVAVVALGCLRALRNVSAPPCSVVVDGDKDYFVVPTMFRVSITERKISFYVLDCLFSVFVVGTLVVFIWRGIWALLDIYLYPDQEEWSAFGSLIIGYAFVAKAFLLQPLMQKLCDHLTGVSRIVVADIFTLFSLVGTVNAWRGIWNLLNIYFLPDDMEMSCWITHWVCLLLLVLLRCSNSLLVRGVYIDAEEPAGECVVFPCYYLRMLLYEERIRKLKRKLQLENKEGRLDGVGNDKIFVVEVNHVASVESGGVELNHKGEA